MIATLFGLMFPAIRDWKRRSVVTSLCGSRLKQPLDDEQVRFVVIKARVAHLHVFLCSSLQCCAGCAGCRAPHRLQLAAAADKFCNRAATSLASPAIVNSLQFAASNHRPRFIGLQFISMCTRQKVDQVIAELERRRGSTAHKSLDQLNAEMHDMRQQAFSSADRSVYVAAATPAPAAASSTELAVVTQ